MGIISNTGLLDDDDDVLQDPRRLPAVGAPAPIQPAPGAGPRIAKPSVGDSGIPPVTLRGISPQRKADESELSRLQTTGSGISQFQKNHRVLGTGLRVLEGLSSAALPGVMMNLPGTTLHHDSLVNSARRAVEGDITNEGREAQANQATAAADKDRSEVALAGQPKPKEEKWSGFKGYTDTDGTPLQHEENSGQVVRASDKKPPTGFKVAALKQEKPDSIDQQYNDAIQRGDHAEAARLLKVKADLAKAGQSPQREPQQLVAVPQPDGSTKLVAATPGMIIPKGATTVQQFGHEQEPNADEKKRADMVENLNENLNQLEDIVNRRPELFGPFSGRMTKAKEWIGSDDPDIATLKGIEDRLGMVQQSAHSMRSAQHVAASADSIVNGFKNGADAMKRAISDARKSGETFTLDAQRGVPQAQPQGGGMIRARDPQGKLQEAPAGTPLPKGWKLEK